MADTTRYDALLRRLRWPLFLTRTGMLAERMARAFWPLWTLCIAVLALLMLGVQDSTSIELVWALAAAAGLGIIFCLVFGALRFRFPRREEAIRRLDGSLKGNPIQSLADDQAIGAQDAGSSALWAAHQARMADRAGAARPVQPDLKLSARDPFGLRYVALLGLMVALLFGSFWRVGSVGGMAPGGAANAAAGPSWEGWVSPPPHTGLPTLYLPDIGAGALSAPEGAEVTLRLYGPEGRLNVAESVSGRVGELPAATDPAQEFSIRRDGEISIDGPGGRVWQVAMVPDLAPTATIDGPGEASVDGDISIPFSVTDDYGVERGIARISLDLEAVDRRYGLTLEPEAREAIEVPLPMPISGSREAFSEVMIENFSQHPWANMPVTVSLTVTDSIGQEGHSDPYKMLLDARRFFDPVATALIEMRRDLLWNRDNAPRVAQVMRAITWQGQGLFDTETTYLRARVLMRRIGAISEFTRMTDDQVAEITQALWDLAIEIEDGDLDDAKARMDRAQERLSEAMRNGASDQEIARLMQELRDATEDYMRQLSQQAARDSEANPDQPNMSMDNAMQMNQGDLQRMMDRIQELMEQGRMAEAQQALEELQRLMENMQVTQGQGGEGQQSPGQQAMEGLAETLRDQQGLSDEAFRELQEQFNGQQGQGQQPQGQGQQQGQQQPGQGQQPGQQGQGNQPGQGQPGSGDQTGPDAGSLAQRQQELRRELERQRGNLPGAGSAEGRAARESLEDADRAMGGAEEALRDGDLAEAIDRQSQAMEALREGMRQMGDAMAQQENQMAGQQGQSEGENPGQQNDPLGRSTGTNGDLGNSRDMLQGDDVYRRAQNLLDEIRRRSGENRRSEAERDYLKRLLDRF
ncbi:TIGR02302 family protein [Pseudooceanicola algae]|uniref:TIGR02302 family protein n=1 Tax=Pseudooceanicola algae TaxID=1537215 RepID=A0A418SKD0_9RHOB|nr:TIGR02302 family protein [Pseudooceanicola algae]QPM90684.1 hypothetical protein PSAL_019230 [Pseudooceanicola algae]